MFSSSGLCWAALRASALFLLTCTRRIQLTFQLLNFLRRSTERLSPDSDFICQRISFCRDSNDNRLLCSKLLPDGIDCTIKLAHFHGLLGSALLRFLYLGAQSFSQCFLVGLKVSRASPAVSLPQFSLRLSANSALQRQKRSRLLCSKFLPDGIDCTIKLPHFHGLLGSALRRFLWFLGAQSFC